MTPTKFNIKNIQDKSSVLIYGSRGSGKTSMIKKLIEQKYTNTPIILFTTDNTEYCESSKFNRTVYTDMKEFYETNCNNKILLGEISDDFVCDFIEKQIVKKEHILLIFDDIINDWKKLPEQFRVFLLDNKDLNVSQIIATSSFVTYKLHCDYTIILNVNENSLLTIWRTKYISMFLYKEFQEIYNKLTENNEMMVIYNKSIYKYNMNTPNSMKIYQFTFGTHKNVRKIYVVGNNDNMMLIINELFATFDDIPNKYVYDVIDKDSTINMLGGRKSTNNSNDNECIIRKYNFISSQNQKRKSLGLNLIDNRHLIIIRSDDNLEEYTNIVKLLDNKDFTFVFCQTTYQPNTVTKSCNIAMYLPGLICKDKIYSHVSKQDYITVIDDIGNTYWYNYALVN